MFWPSCKLPVSFLIDTIIQLGVDLPRAVWSPRKKEIKSLLKEIGFVRIKIYYSYTLDHYIVIAER